MNRTMEKAIEDGIKVPSVLERVASTIRGDLFSGPTYFDENGEVCDWMDGVRQFDFKRACGIVSNWLDNLDTHYYESWSGYVVRGPLTFEPDEEEAVFEEVYELDRSTIAVALFGREVASHV